jgi:hypothetical protein
MSFSFSPKIVTDGLVLYLDAANTRSYPGSGTTWSDLSRSGNNGTLVNGPTFNGANGGSIVFDGTNDYVATNLGTLRSLTGTRSTLNIWFRTVNSSTRQVLLADWNSAGALETARLEISGFNISPNKVGGTINGISNSTPVQSTTSIQNNTWYWVTILYNGTNTQLYLNGQLEQSLATTERGSDSTGHVAIGRAGDFNGLYWNGNIANIQIYNRALSATEILQNYNATKNRYL